MEFSQENKKKVFLILSILSAGFIILIIPFARKLSVIFSWLQENSLFYPFMVISFAGIWSLCFLLVKESLRVRFPGIIISLLSSVLLIYLILTINILLEKIHLLMYGAFSVFLFFYFLFCLRKLPALLFSVCLSFNLGLLDELIQYFVPDRVGDYRDIWFNCLSTVISLAVFYPLTLEKTRDRAKTGKYFAVFMLFCVFCCGTYMFIAYIHGFGYRHVDGDTVFYSYFTKKDLLFYDRMKGHEYEREISVLPYSEMKEYIKNFSRRKDPYIYELALRLYRYIYFRNRLKYGELDDKDEAMTAVRFAGEEYILTKYFKNGIKPIKKDIFDHKLKQNRGGSGKYNSMILDDVFFYSSRYMLALFFLFLQVSTGIFLFFAWKRRG